MSTSLRMVGRDFVIGLVVVCAVLVCGSAGEENEDTQVLNVFILAHRYALLLSL